MKGCKGAVKIFLAPSAGLEALLREEVRPEGYHRPRATSGGVIEGGWPEVWRTNL